MPETAQEWLDVLLDPGWVEPDAHLASSDPLGFPGYADRDAKQESVVTADGAVAGAPVVAIAFEFAVFGGSMGVAAGEKIARAFERAIDRGAAVIALTASGGARMQEGMLALAQMAKTIVARRALSAAHLPFLAYLRHPTTGGVYASFAALADVVWAEPGATVSFAGPRVTESSPSEEAEAHTAEFALANGLVDDIVAPERLRAAAGVFLRAALSPDEPAPGSAVEAVRPPHGSWRLVQAARHPGRPGGRRILTTLAEGLIELRGDRAGIDDEGVVAGLGRIAGRRCGVIALDRARPLPAGFRKAYRLFRLAGSLGLPLVTLIDTPGADPSSASEGAGIARTIATTFRTVFEHPAPTVAVVTGEGGSGAALALAVCDRVLVCENAVFSVIAPESAAAILKRDDVERVAAELKLGPADLLELGLADGVVPEPASGADAEPEELVRSIGAHVGAALAELERIPRQDLLSARYRRWREAGNAFLI
jgi:acetyl-CoA carboxylase carboxyl transferase subunit beta